MEVFEDKKPIEPVQEDDGMDDEMRQLALEMLERQKEKERASKPKRSAADVIAALDGSEADAVRSDDESEEKEATYQRGMHRSAPVTAGVKAKKVASKVWKPGEDLIIRDMVANPHLGKDLLSELEAALKIRSIGQIQHRMKFIGIAAPKHSCQHRPKKSGSESESERQPVKRRSTKARAASKAATVAQEQLCCHLVAEVAASGNDALVAGLVWLQTRLRAASQQEEGRVSTARLFWEWCVTCCL
jgi:hypothetical protein